jgi:cytochrome c oxidase subunit 4
MTTPRIVSPLSYFAVYAALLALLAATVGVHFLRLGLTGTALGLFIATLKMILVGAFFMHLRWSSSLMRLAAIAGLFWLGILLGLSMSDYLFRVGQ